MNTSGDRKWLVWFCVLLVILTTIPYLIGSSSESPDWKFTGFLFGVEDGNSYIAKMLNGAAGEWLFRTPYTTVRQDGIIAFLPYILLGKVASPPGLHDQLAALSQLFRWAGIFLYVFASYDIAAIFLTERRQRRLAAAVIACGGGLGWLYFTGLATLWGGSLPLEFYSPETFGFLELFGLPHLAAARALLLWGLARVLKDQNQTWSWKEASSFALIWFGIGLFQPLDVAIGWVVLGAFWIVRILFHRNQAAILFSGQFLRRSIIAMASSLPWLVYSGAIFMTDSFAAVWMEQNILKSPPFWHYLLAYGWLIPAAIAGVILIWKNKNPDHLSLPIWFAFLLGMAYFPVNVQRRLVESGWVAVVILAVLGLEKLFEKRPKLAVFYLAPVFLPGVLFLTGMAQTAAAAKMPVFLPRGTVACYHELAGKAAADAVVLADRQNSNRIPAWANIRTLIGHGPESAGEKELEPQVSEFYQGKLPVADLQKWVAQDGIEYVYYEKTFQFPDITSNRYLNLLQPWFENQACLIFKVVSGK